MALEWFLGFDVLFEVMFAIITFAVALLAFKVYKITSQKQPFYLAWAFVMISISNIVQAVFNFFIIAELNESIYEVAEIHSINLFNIVGIYAHIFFMVMGLSLLAFMTLRTDKVRVFFLVLGLSLASILFNPNPLYMFFVVSSILLIAVAWFYIDNFLNHKKQNTLMIAIAFLFLLFGNIHFFFSVNHQLFYIIGNFVELIAYGLVLSNYFMVLKR